MSISEIIEKYPQCSKIFIEYGFSCVSCSISKIETIKQGIMGHGILEEDFYKILEKLNSTAKLEIKEVLEVFNISDIAAENILKIKNNNTDLNFKKYLRISYLNKQENMEFTNLKNENDIIFFKNELKIIIDKNSFENLRGKELDYLKNKDYEGFTFKQQK